MGVELPLAYLLDVTLGDPPNWPHPVRWLGRLITFLEAPLRRTFTDPRLAGLVLTGVCLIAAGGTAWGAVWLARHLHPLLGSLATVLLIYWAISIKDLADHARAVHQPLSQGDLAGARQALAKIVGRETSQLSEAGVIRATVETIAENTVDGVLSPLFYAAVGGPPLVWAFKAVSTLDSMVGYKSEPYRQFGWAGARLDDLLNWLPARLSGGLFTLAAGLLGLDWRQTWVICRRDGRRHASPNAGWPEAALSGALGLRLGGPNVYHGEVVNKPWLGDGWREPETVDILTAIRLLHIVSALAVIFLFFLALAAKILLT
jgi:adenosylcobinamide-phosphate synthase